METIRNNPLPVSILIALVIVGGGILVLNKDRFVRDKDLQGVSPSTVSLASVSAQESNESDTDKDGLPDWKEGLYGSDLRDTDTDKDGTWDGDEVRVGRDPTRKGPGDSLNVFQDLRFATSESDVLGLKQEFFAKFLAERATEIRELTLRDVVKANLDTSKFKPRYQVVDMKVTSDSSKEAIAKYGNDFGTLINKYSGARHRSETDILLDGISTKSTAILQELQYPATSYLNFSKDLRTITVPMPVLKHHLMIVNAYDIMGRSLLAMQQLYTNPIEGAAGYESYTKYRLDVITGYGGVVKVIAEYNVTYGDTDPGLPFYRNTVRFPPSKFKQPTEASTSSDTIGSEPSL